MSPTPLTRPSLLVRLKDKRNERAWGEFMEIYEPVVHRLARRGGLQDADAREVVQEVMVAVSGAIARWDPDRNKGSFRAWLARITRNVTVNLLVHRQRNPQAVGGTEMAVCLQQTPDERADAQAVRFDAEYKRQLFRWAAQQIRDDFQETTWQAFWSTCVEGESVRQVANRLKVSSGVVYVSRSRIMARLRTKIQSLTVD